MKYIIVFFAMLLSMSAFSQQISYQEFQDDAKTQINLQPEYGNAKKTKEDLQADKEFIEFSLKNDTTPRKASEHLVRLGFTHLYQGDIETAMRRFNQAWLLDPTNENAYWGYGAIYFTFNDSKSTLEQYEKGLRINPKSTNILTDEATVYMVLFENEKDVVNLDKAILIFGQSYNIDSLNQNTLFKLSVCYYFKSDCKNALRYYNECKKLGGKNMGDDYIKALMAKCSK